MNQEIRKKAQEISYYIFRLSHFIRSTEIRNRLEGQSCQLIEQIYSNDSDGSIRTLGILGGLLALSTNTGYINSSNARSLIERTKSLENELKSQKIAPKEALQGNTLNIGQNNRIIRQSGNQKLPIVKLESQKAQNRQTEILNFVKNRGKAQLRDVIMAFPVVSERTLRYDLRLLCERAKILRKGSGGPSNYYIPVENPNLSSGAISLLASS